MYHKLVAQNSGLKAITAMGKPQPKVEGAGTLQRGRLSV